MTHQIDLPDAVSPGPTKPEIRAILLQKLALLPTDHFVDVGAGTGAVSITAGRRAERVTAIERDPDRVEAIRSNVRANDVEATVEVRKGEAPESLPDSADAVFIGGTRRFEEVLDEIRQMGTRRVVLNAARLETAARAVTAFEECDLLEEVLTLRIERGYDLGGETGFRGDNPVFMIVGSAPDTAEAERRGEEQ